MTRAKELMDTAIQSQRYARIIDAAHAAIARGIDPTSQAMVDAIRSAVPGVDQSEIDEALQWNLES